MIYGIKQSDSMYEICIQYSFGPFIVDMQLFRKFQQGRFCILNNFKYRYIYGTTCQDSNINTGLLTVTNQAYCGC